MRLMHRLPSKFLTKPHLGIGVLAVIYMWVRSWYWSQRPIYDALEYYSIMRNFTDSHFNLLKGTADHNAQLWMLVAGIANIVFPHNYIVFNIWISILSTGSVIAMYAIIRQLCGGLLMESEIVLATALVAFNPSILCNLIHFSPDTGIFLFMTFTCLALLKKQRLLAIFCGSVLVFSKEQGVAYLGLLHAFCAYQEPKWWDKIRFMFRNKFSLIIPYSLMLAYMVYKTIIHHQPFFFNNPNIFTGIDHKSFLNYVLMCFVLNTNWLIIGTMLVGALFLARKPATSLQVQAYRKTGPAYLLLFLSVLTIVLAVRHWSNDRYLLAFNFTLMLCFIYVLPGFHNTRTRHSILATMLVLLTWQNFRTLDPISKQVFCTTAFGNHTTLHIPVDNDCFLHSQEKEMLKDQYVYNLEFTHIARIETQIIEAHPPGVTYVGNNYYKLAFPPQISAISKLPVLLAGKNKNDFYVLRFPGAPLGLHPYNIKASFKKVGPVEKFSVDGYSLDVYHFVRKSILDQSPDAVMYKENKKALELLNDFLEK